MYSTAVFENGFFVIVDKAFHLTLQINFLDLSILLTMLATLYL
jgi:hypothetical protein